MCGIAGIITHQQINSDALFQMIDAMVHRGPDGKGYWFSEDMTVALGHRRLSILDLSDSGTQPMSDRSGNYIITFNGEIYNYLELRQELRNYGAKFASNTDTEVILEAYKQWGTDCLQHFNGMFAFALYDRTAQVLFCARDRYGEKPFLYALTQHYLVFASEYKAMLQLTEVGANINEMELVLSSVVAGKGLDSKRQTVFSGIQQLLPSEAMLLDLKSFETKIWTYWTVTRNTDYSLLPEPEANEQFRDLLIDSVRLRMRSDVPVGSCLSGGLDSSVIVSIVKKQLLPDTVYHTFTGIFPGTKADEWPYAKQVIDDTNVVSHVVEPTSEKLSVELADFIWYNELPVNSSSQYAQWCVFRLAKEHNITVLLDGQGSDELLGGYEQYFRFYLQTLQDQGEYRRYNEEIGAIKARYPSALPTTFVNLRERVPFTARYLYANYFRKGNSLLYGLKRDASHQMSRQTGYECKTDLSTLSAVLHQDSFGRFLTTLLRYGDRNSMAHSREVRLPFCDHRLAELVFSLPASYLMGGVQTKRLLRESSKGILHEAIRTRWNKQGFRPPQEVWFKGELMQQAQDLFHSTEFTQSDQWDAGWWQSALSRIAAGESGLSWVVWQPFIIQVWKKYFVKSHQFGQKISIFQ
ncbi:asparagine synthase (glutamine-hydrolyzing) [Nibrella viscosa]|uniref:asparagine synthase (glutamine-hydrolyzing) n=1 Tax=Nibrella viscosa TaxID=1084524 RepID=A0ABP8KGA0_9BACT